MGSEAYDVAVVGGGSAVNDRCSHHVSWGRCGRWSEWAVWTAFHGQPLGRVVRLGSIGRTRGVDVFRRADISRNIYFCADLSAVVVHTRSVSRGVDRLVVRAQRARQGLNARRRARQGLSARQSLGARRRARQGRWARAMDVWPGGQQWRWRRERGQ